MDSSVLVVVAMTFDVTCFEGNLLLLFYPVLSGYVKRFISSVIVGQSNIHPPPRLVAVIPPLSS